MWWNVVKYLLILISSTTHLVKGLQCFTGNEGGKITVANFKDIKVYPKKPTTMTSLGRTAFRIQVDELSPMADTEVLLSGLDLKATARREEISYVNKSSNNKFVIIMTIGILLLPYFLQMKMSSIYSFISKASFFEPVFFVRGKSDTVDPSNGKDNEHDEKVTELIEVARSIDSEAKKREYVSAWLSLHEDSWKKSSQRKHFKMICPTAAQGVKN
ncbi:hypothetical protein Y032_0016g3011 [Ancylostoma ceylanicum]|uniref:Uncharacterized protein n=1 Tax=Ancylostoma ceylanicum TaxID=53326 RepID=A0A016V620_9BILA|nr:hypothetical protein Y032_0016g3011 [Ancylostoma ceylanicum]